MQDQNATKFSHVNAENQPTMVDVSDKQISKREALAMSAILLPESVLAALNPAGEIISPKGPVFQTAIIAGTMAVKRTHELIPFCHPLPLEQISIEIKFGSDNPARIEIHCRVKVHHKTGVEMEALTGASIAALTVYDMCKALSHDIIIQETRLLLKTGGKNDFQKNA
jgi:cyclic pyranopterin monophosphate synthase